MARDFAIGFYHSEAWRRTRAAYMRIPVKTDFGIVPPQLCERCFSQGRYKPAKVVHHKIHLSPQNINDPNITLSFDNFQRLCQDCHAAVHSGIEPIRCAFDEYGNPIPKEDP